MALVNIVECSEIIRRAAKSRWPESEIREQIRQSFWRRIEGRIVYAIAEEVARSRKSALLAR